MDFASLTLFLQAAIIGVLIAAPVGPIGLLTMQRTLERGLAAGLATGLGAAAADAVYGAIGAFSMRWLIDLLASAKTPLALGGGALLLVLAWRTWHAPVAHTAAPARDARGLLGLASGTFALTLANPATIVSFIAVFGSLGGGQQAMPSPLWMVAGVLAGSAAWWLLLTGAIAYQRRRFTPTWRQRINQASALLLGGFALWQWVQLV
ncbi:LysE family translocator [Acidovorax radicis]|uniref:LysE family translocator n=1 Tax=Acidovorax radicis TaxID=758826 RepID=UPI0002376E1E|nr:LysE family transporter [Acidovorax radicis]